MTRWRKEVRKLGVDPQPFGRNARAAFTTAKQISLGQATKPIRTHSSKAA